MCVTTESGCNGGGSPFGANATFDTNLAIKYSPRSVPSIGVSEYGIWFTYIKSDIK